MEAHGDCVEKRNNSKDVASGKWYFIPKEKKAIHIGQFRPISLLNLEGKSFFSVLARRLVSYLKANSLIDISVQNAGIPFFLYIWNIAA